MTGLGELMREYERARYPAERRLDLHGEGPLVARERALRWIQSHAHEEPGQELLLIVARGQRPGRPPTPVEAEVRALLEELRGRLVDWWQPFTPGSLALAIAREPRMTNGRIDAGRDPGEGRTEDTAGAARPDPENDIPPELLDLATRTAELRVEREQHSIRVLGVVLREVWIEAQALAMEHRLGFDQALEHLRQLELERIYDP